MKPGKNLGETAAKTSSAGPRGAFDYLPIYGSGFIQIWVHDPYRVIGWVVVRMWNGAARGGTLMQLFPPTLCVHREATDTRSSVELAIAMIRHVTSLRSAVKALRSAVKSLHSARKAHLRYKLNENAGRTLFQKLAGWP